MTQSSHPAGAGNPDPGLADLEAEFPGVTFAITESGHCLAWYPGLENPLRDRNLVELRAQLRLMRGMSCS